MRLHQIHQRTGTVNKVPRGETPQIELRLYEHERVISIDTHRIDKAHRSTVDWVWTAWVDDCREAP